MTFGICSANLGLQQASFRGVLDIEWKGLNLQAAVLIIYRTGSIGCTFRNVNMIIIKSVQRSLSMLQA